MRIRDKIINRLHRLAKVPEGEMSPKWLNIIWKILFPIESFLIANKKFNYLPHKQSFIIDGVELSRFCLLRMGEVLNGEDGEYLQISKIDGEVIWTRVTQPLLKPEIIIKSENDAIVAMRKAKDALEGIPRAIRMPEQAQLLERLEKNLNHFMQIPFQDMTIQQRSEMLKYFPKEYNEKRINYISNPIDFGSDKN